MSHCLQKLLHCSWTYNVKYDRVDPRSLNGTNWYFWRNQAIGSQRKLSKDMDLYICKQSNIPHQSETSFYLFYEWCNSSTLEGNIENKPELIFFPLLKNSDIFSIAVQGCHWLVRKKRLCVDDLLSDPDYCKIQGVVLINCGKYIHVFYLCKRFYCKIHYRTVLIWLYFPLLLLLYLLSFQNDTAK